ncbi:MAG TPA: aminotransferase class I/II-fold pyridoxal phosphate-dependent enzyme [Chitinophagales bacterium]|nr:aminotransferase class I/II-fold pyridoxal phosphate-dependent enzyme [Chitinophagales bacterium]
MQNKMWLSSPHMCGREEGYVKDAFDTNWIAPLGPHVNGFEQGLSARMLEHPVAALSSGTAALHLALILLGVERDDVVICQSFTFSASANPIVYQGAVPYFVDSEADTWNMDPDLLEEAISRLVTVGKRPKAVVVVHLYGMPAKMDRITEICERYQVPVVEDAAEALGSALHEKPCGTFGRFGVLSFNGNKIITTSGGGALVCPDDAFAERARFLATQARDTAPHYQHSVIGYNYRMSNVCAAIGRGQLEVLDQRVEQRRKNFAYYQETLSDLPGISFLSETAGSFSNRWLTCITIDPDHSGGVTRESVRLALETQQIESRPLWKPMHLQPVFANAPAMSTGVSERLFNTGLCLPSGSNLTSEDLSRVVEHIRKNWK